MVLGDLDSYMKKKMKLDHQLTPYTKINAVSVPYFNSESALVLRKVREFGPWNLIKI